METGKSNAEGKSGFMLSLLYEFFGTAFVVYAFALSDKDPWYRAVAFFAGYIFAIHVSGGHFNPATSLAVFICEKDK
jgi:glycerol uptake facilitator-like aquaporin